MIMVPVLSPLDKILERICSPSLEREIEGVKPNSVHTCKQGHLVSTQKR
jgi:hypothetical protein